MLRNFKPRECAPHGTMTGGKREKPPPPNQLVEEASEEMAACTHVEDSGI